MLRLILFFALIAMIAVAFASIMLALRAISPQHGDKSGDTMPKTLQTISYVLLIVLMFGVITGWMGAA